MSQYISSNEKILLQRYNSSRDIVETLRYMKYNGWDHIGTIRMKGKHDAVLTMKEEYTDEDIEEILSKMSSIFMCSVLAKWNNKIRAVF